jgi:hypothetical protein
MWYNEHYLGQSFALLVCNNLIEVVRWWEWYTRASSWFGDGDDTHAQRIVTLH